MPSRLNEILQTVRERLQARRGDAALRELEARASDRTPARDLKAALRRRDKEGGALATLRIIGELKRRSPSAGEINSALDPVESAVELEATGCAALSVLTEPDFFGGSLTALSRVRSNVELPLLRKDFIVDPFQVVEARAYGADAILLLAAALDDAALQHCAESARRWGMAVLAEAHDPAELERLLGLDFEILGVNARDLHSFEVDLPRALGWAAQIPAEKVVVAESGLRTREDAERVARERIDAALVGEGLMRGQSPGGRFVELFGEATP